MTDIYQLNFKPVAPLSRERGILRIGWEVSILLNEIECQISGDFGGRWYLFSSDLKILEQTLSAISSTFFALLQTFVAVEWDVLVLKLKYVRSSLVGVNQWAVRSKGLKTLLERSRRSKNPRQLSKIYK